MLLNVVVRSGIVSFSVLGILVFSGLYGIRIAEYRPLRMKNVKDDWLPPKEASGSACFEMPFAFRWTQISSENLPMEEAMMIALKTMIR
jgi:hypothetical protein